MENGKRKMRELRFRFSNSYFQLPVFLFLVLLVTAVSTPKPVTASDPQAGIDWRFGVIESYEAPGEAGALGASWTRIQFHWAETQPNGSGEWLPQVSDAQINGEINAGRLVTGLLIGIPGWATDDKGLPRGLWLPHDDPNNTWAVFVRDAVTRYQGRIDHWTIWNEPDISAGAVAHTWNGSVEDFFQLQRTAYLVAKQANPNAVIHLAAFTHFWDPGYFNRFLDVVMADPAAAENNYYFDVTSAHLYFQSGMIYDIIQVFYGAMGGHGIWKPLWLAETNAPPVNDPDWPVPDPLFAVTLDEQAAFMPQALASALAAGAQRIAVFKLKDTPTDRAANPEPFGLISMNGRRRPAFTTYQVAMRYLSGMTAVARERWDGVGQIRLEQGSQTTTVLFSRLPAPQQAQVTATANTAVLVDMWGARQTITAVDGVFPVHLPGALCRQTMGDYCMIGGRTYYLVQTLAGGGVPAVPPAPAAPPSAGGDTAGSANPDPSGPVVTLNPTRLAVHGIGLAGTPTPDVTDTATATNTATVTPTAVATSVPTATPTKISTPTVTHTAVPTINIQQPIPNNQQPTTNNLSYWFIGAGVGLMLGLGGWAVRNGRRR